jgi:tetratricopeptide (TPR) repeat protein
VRDRLRDLGARYALLSGGDLHATVREYLRRFWRDEAERPTIFDDVLAAIERAIESLPPAVGEEGTPEVIARRTLQLNLQSWRDGDRAVVDLARFLAIALAYEEGVEDVQSLLKELPLAQKELSEAKKLWKKPEASSDRKKVIAWLRITCGSSKSWSEHEQACLAIVEGVTQTSWGMQAKDALPVFLRLKIALDYFGTDRLPQKQAAGEAVFVLGWSFDPYGSKEKQWVDLAEEAYLLANRLGSREASCHNNLGVLYLDHLGRYTDAENACLKAIKLDPKDANSHYCLGLLYRDHLVRPTDAEKAFLKAIELDPKDANPHIGLGWLYAEHLNQPDDAENAFLQGIQLNPKSGIGQRGLAWLCLLHSGNLQLAQQYTNEAIAIDPTHRATQFVAISVTTWTTIWTDVQSKVPEWLAGCTARFVVRVRKRLIALVRKIHEQDSLSTLAEMLRAVEDRPWWKPWSEAVSALAAGTGPGGFSSDEATWIYEAISKPKPKDGQSG